MSREPKKPMAQKDSRKNGFLIFLDELSRSSFLVTLLAILTGLILGGILVAVTTLEVYTAMKESVWSGLGIAFNSIWQTFYTLFIGSVGSPSDIIAAFQSGDALTIRRAIAPFFESLVQTTPYIYAGLAVALGFRVGLFNIGAEGQIFIGAAGAAWAGYTFTGLPVYIHIPVALLFGALAGGIWGFIPGILKAKTGAHEVINTMMMNYIAFRLSDWLLRIPMRDPNEVTPKSPWILESAKMIRFFDTPIRFHIGFFIALLMAFLVWWLLFKTTLGFELRTVGLNPSAAKYAGMKVTSAIVIGMSLSGALAGMAGANEVLGVNYRLVMGFSSGYGFDSIALALLGKSHPLGVVLASLLFGFLRNGARLMQVRADVPIDIVSILQALILAFIAAPAIIRTLYRLKEQKEEQPGISTGSWRSE